MRTLLLLLCSAGALGLALVSDATWADAAPAPRPVEMAVPNELPRAWSLDEIARETPPYGSAGRVYVLAWKVVEDDRPLRVESCLVFKVLGKRADGGYSLAHLYRHPDSNAKPQWRLSMLYASGVPADPGRWLIHCKRFTKKPGNKEIYSALSSADGVSWDFGVEEGWKCLGSKVCEKSWLEAIGEKPTQFFARGPGSRRRRRRAGERGERFFCSRPRVGFARCQLQQLDYQETNPWRFRAAGPDTGRRTAGAGAPCA